MGKYTEVGKDEQDNEVTSILEEGHITPSNITSMNFEFSKPADITASLDKRNTRNLNSDIPQNPGRTGNTRVTVVYPNKETSTRATLTQCVVQYRETMLKESGKDYGNTYINVGIPKMYLDRLFSNARGQSIRLENREKTREKSGYYWVDCDIRRLDWNDIWIFWTDENGESQAANKQIRDVLTALRQNVECTLTVTITGNITNKHKNEDLPLDTGAFHPSIKISEVIVKNESQVESPDLSEFSNQGKNEKSEKTEASLASGKVLAMALDRLKMG